MIRTILVTICTAMLFVPVALSQHAHSHSDSSQVMRTHHPVGESDGKPATITGYVRDVACLLRNPKAGAATTPLTQDCMQKCIRGGSPIGILTEEGRLYTPISDVIPDASVRSRMLPYVGKYIKASGKVFERGEFHAISIQSIEIIDRPADSRIPAL